MNKLVGLLVGAALAATPALGSAHVRVSVGIGSGGYVAPYWGPPAVGVVVQPRPWHRHWRYYWSTGPTYYYYAPPAPVVVSPPPAYYAAPPPAPPRCWWDSAGVRYCE